MEMILSKSQGDNDIIVLKDTASKELINFSIVDNQDLLISYGENSSILIKGQWTQEGQIEKLQLADGSYLTNEDFEDLLEDNEIVLEWHTPNDTDLFFVS